MKKVIYITILQLIFFSCKPNDKNVFNINKDLFLSIYKKTESRNIQKKEVNIIDNNIQINTWLFYKISKNPLVNLNNMTRDEIMKKFNKTKIEISEKLINVNGYCNFEPYITKKKPIDFFSSKKTLDIYRNELSNNGIKLSDIILIYQSLYPEKDCKNTSAEYFVTDNTLVFSYQGYLLFFKKGEKPLEKSIDCYSKTKITGLPITKNVINVTGVWGELDCSIANLVTKNYLRLPDINAVKVFIIGNFDYDDFTYTLVTLKDRKIITNRNIGFAENSENGKNITSITEFEIDKNYEFHLKTKIKKGGNFKTSKIEKFKIDENGLIVR